jgi:hypothetical protein
VEAFRPCHEPAIYYLARGSERTKRVAGSFGEHVRKLTTDRRFIDRLFLGLEPDCGYQRR